MAVAGLVVSGDGAPEKVQRKLEELLLEHQEAVAAALYVEGLAIEAEAVKRTPVDFGRLRASKFVAPPVKQSGGGLLVELGFGTDYAVFVHEDTSARHVTGEAKFLENAIAARTPGFAERLARRAAGFVKKGVTMAPLDASMPTSPQDIGDGADMHGPSLADKIRAERRARRTRVRAKRAARKAAKAAAAGAARKQRRATKAAVRRANKAWKSTVKKQRAAAARDAARARKRARREAKAIEKLRRKGVGKDFDF